MLLLNYAFKSGFKPIYIEGDPKGNCDKIDINRGPGIMSCFIYDNNERKNNGPNITPNNTPNNIPNNRYRDRKSVV